MTARDPIDRAGLRAKIAADPDLPCEAGWMPEATPMQAARQAYRDAHLRLERIDPLSAAIAAYLRARAEIYQDVADRHRQDYGEDDPMHEPLRARAAHYRDLAAEVERQSEKGEG